MEVASYRVTHGEHQPSSLCTKNQKQYRTATKTVRRRRRKIMNVSKYDNRCNSERDHGSMCSSNRDNRCSSDNDSRCNSNSDTAVAVTTDVTEK